ncbi:MAG: aminoacyl-histidine dipeptidase [Sedimentibacter sp.]|nr:aminoacyl-histidine dipeptidase [Sedimentibacter sp.]
MKRVLEGLKPEKVFYYFEEISQIPRGSGNEKQISDYLYNLAKLKGWDVIQDDYFNIIIKKPATVGYENSPTVMLQGHMDMVCEKNEGVKHDFEKDPIKLRIIEGNLYATETTLGADNGIAVAYALSILDSDDVKHPPLEVLITVDEEKGMTGAENVDANIFKARYLLNLDSEEEGVFTCGCAGGGGINFRIPVKYQDIKKVAYKVSIGSDIDKERGNANKILGRILYDLYDDIELISIKGGSKGNAIPRESQALIAVSNMEKVQEKIIKWNNILKNEYSFTDSAVNVTLENLGYEAAPLVKDVFKKVVHAINLIPTGVFTKSTAIDLVISSNNLGVITQNEEYVELQNQARSSVKSLLTDNIAQIMKQIGETLDIECNIGGFYPGWEYAKESELREICIETFKNIYGHEPVVSAIHAGLECGLLLEKISGLDAISMGPDAYDVHSPNEHISIKSTENVYNLLLEILKRIK